LIERTGRAADRSDLCAHLAERVEARLGGITSSDHPGLALAFDLHELVDDSVDIETGTETAD
jgi:hypothetical protein